MKNQVCKIVSSTEAINKVNWHQFVKNNGTGNFFQTPIFIELVTQVPGYSPITLFALGSKDEFLGVLCGVLQKEGTGIKSFLSSRIIIYGGPIINSTNLSVAGFLIKSLINIYKSKSIYIEFRNLFETEFLKKVLLNLKFSYKRHLNIIIPLDNLSSVKSRMSESRLRQVKSGLKSGAIIRQAESIDEVRAFFQILQRKYSEKIKKPLVCFSLFENFYNLPDAGKIFIINFQDKVIGGIVCPIFENKIIYEWYIGGMDDEFKKQHPSVLATYAPIEFGIQAKISRFDFMGAGSPNLKYGVREFKSKFGGSQVDYGRYTHINNHFLFHVGKIGLFILGMLKRI